jgi:DNA-binding Lrp family transcriptional regulator
MLLADSVTYSDHLLLYYLRENARNPLTISHNDLAIRLGIPEMTIRRAMTRLVNAGLVKRSRPYGGVYTYEVTDDNSQQSA